MSGSQDVNQTSIELISQNNAKLRVTQSYLDIAWIAVPPVFARVTQVYIEVPYVIGAPPPPPNPPVLACPSITIGTVGVFFSATLTVSGGVAPFTFLLISGALPPGLSLNSSTGVISGIPTTAGTFSYSIRVTDANGAISNVTCQIVISQGTITGGMPCH